jgi:hypothetical protein
MNKAQQIEAVMQARPALADHREVWPRILPGLETLHALSATQDWDIASIRQLLDEGRAFLLTDEADDRAFAVCRVDVFPYDTDDLELFVYLVWHQGGDAIARFQPHIEQVARTAGANHIRFYSPRRGMLRAAMRVGYVARAVEYIKELSDGRWR